MTTLTPTAHPARPRTLDIDVATTDGCTAAVLATYTSTDPDGAVYDAHIRGDLAAITHTVTIWLPANMTTTRIRLTVEQDPATGRPA